MYVKSATLALVLMASGASAFAPGKIDLRGSVTVSSGYHHRLKLRADEYSIVEMCITKLEILCNLLTCGLRGNNKHKYHTNQQ